MDKKEWKTPTITAFGDVAVMTQARQRILTGNWPKNVCARWADPVGGGLSLIKECGVGDAVNQATGLPLELGS